MRRKFIASLFALLAVVVALTAAPAVGALDDARGPTCVDIVATGNYQPTTHRLGVKLLPAGVPACQQFTYTLYVVVDEGTAPVAYSQQGSDEFVVNIADDDETICIGATTSVGGHTFDTAPDSFDPTTGAGCLVVEAGGPVGGSQGFN